MVSDIALLSAQQALEHAEMKSQQQKKIV